MAVRTATVFGASGFIGRYVVRELARTGAQIRAAVRDPEAALFLKPMGDVGQIAPVQANVRDEASVRAAVEGADTVINLVGVLYERGRQRFDAIHAAGAGRIARAAADAHARRLVHVSAIGADASAPAHYARSKAAGETAVRAAFAQASIVRPSVVFGVEDDFYNRLAWLARLMPVVPLIGGGRTRFQPVYVADVAAGIVAALARQVPTPPAGSTNSPDRGSTASRRSHPMSWPGPAGGGCWSRCPSELRGSRRIFWSCRRLRRS